MQTQICSQGQRSCLSCHMPSEGRLTNKFQPAHKASNSSQPSQQETKLHRNTALANQNPVDGGPVDLTWQPRQFLFKGPKVLASLFRKNQSTDMNSYSPSSSREWHRKSQTSLNRTCFKPSIADNKVFLLDLCCSLKCICLNLFVNSYNVRKCLDLLFALLATRVLCHVSPEHTQTGPSNYRWDRNDIRTEPTANMSKRSRTVHDVLKAS